MRRLAATVLLVCGAATAAQADIRSYDLRLRVDSSGDGTATLTLSLADAAPTVRVPVGFQTVTGLAVTAGPEGTTVSAQPGGRQAVLLVTLPPATPRPVTLTIDFRVPAVMPAPMVREGERPTMPEGARMFAHVFVNTEPAPIDRYVVEASFPVELRAHAVREALPKLRASEAGPRVQLDGRDGAQVARLDTTRLAQGESASMRIELTRQARTWTWLIAGGVLSLLYLLSFRDLVSRPAAPTPDQRARME